MLFSVHRLLVGSANQKYYQISLQIFLDFPEFGYRRFVTYLLAVFCLYVLMLMYL